MPSRWANTGTRASRAARGSPELLPAAQHDHVERAAEAFEHFADRLARGERHARDRRLGGALDVIVPRGGKSLVDRVQREARVPVFAHLEGIVHVYVDHTAELDKATKHADQLEDAPHRNLRRRRDAADRARRRAAAGCAVRGDEATQAVDQRVTPASEADWRTEYLDAIISASVVDGLDARDPAYRALGSHHTDFIVTEDAAGGREIPHAGDSAIVLRNASTQFADGGESAWARRRHRHRQNTRAGRWASSSSPPSSTGCAGMGETRP